MKTFILLFGHLGTMVLASQLANAQDPKVPKHEVFNGYFVSNKFAPDAPESFVAISDQKKFDEVFGVAFVMRDKSHRLPKDAFKQMMVLAVVKRGMSTWDFRVEKVEENDDNLEIHYTAKSSPRTGASYASPLIVGVPKKDYKSVIFFEGSKLVRSLKLKD